MNDYQNWRRRTAVILHHFAVRNGQGHPQKQSNQISAEWAMLIMVGGNGMWKKAIGEQATAYG
jgi:hypothetical protein